MIWFVFFSLHWKHSCSGSALRPMPETFSSVWNRTKTVSWWILSVNRWSPRGRSHRTQVNTAHLYVMWCDDWTYSNQKQCSPHWHTSVLLFLQQTTGWTRCWGKLVEPTSQSSASPSWTRRARTVSWRVRSSPASNLNMLTRSVHDRHLQWRLLQSSTLKNSDKM